MFKKDIYEKVGGAPHDLKTNGDWLTWLKMLCYGKVAFVAEPLNYFRYHGASVIAKASENKDSNKFYQKYDLSMRKEFKSFLKKEHLALSGEFQLLPEEDLEIRQSSQVLDYLDQQPQWSVDLV